MNPYDKLFQQVADIALHMEEFPNPTESETQLISTVKFLCDSILTMADEMKKLEAGTARKDASHG